MRRREFIKFSTSFLLPITSGCASSKILSRQFPIRPYRYSNEAKIKSIFESKDDPLTLKYIQLYQQLIRGIYQLYKEYRAVKYIKLSDFVNLYSILLFKFLQMFIYITILKTTNNKPKVIVKNQKIIIPPGYLISYKQHGFCMNKTYPAPVQNDLLRLKPLVESRIPEEILPIFKCVILNKDKLKNPQGIVWFLIELDKIPYSDLTSSKYSSILNELDKVCPNSKNSILNYKKTQIPKEILLTLLKSFEVKLNGKTYTLDNLISNPNATQELINNLIQQGAKTPSPKGPGYSQIARDLYAKTIGMAPLTAKVDILNFSYKPVEFSPLDYYIQPAAKKQRISPISNVEDLSVHIPHPSKSETFYQKLLCDLVKKAEEIFSKIFPEKGDKLLEQFADRMLNREKSKLRELLGDKIADFLAKILKKTPIARGIGIYESMCGKSFLFCSPLSCKERIFAFISIFSPLVADFISKISDKIDQVFEIIKENKGDKFPIVVDNSMKNIVNLIEKCEKATLPICNTLCITSWFKGDPFSHKTTLADVIIDCQASNN